MHFAYVHIELDLYASKSESCRFQAMGRRLKLTSYIRKKLPSWKYLGVTQLGLHSITI